MPYIEQHARRQLAEGHPPETLGELNYSVTQLVLGYLERFDQPSYAGYNAVVGVLESAKLELYRRMVSVYEDQKRDENGEVFPV